MKRSRRQWLKVALGAGALVALPTIGRPAGHLAWTALHDRDTRRPLPPGVVDDASRMNRTRVAELHDVLPDPAAAEQQLGGLLRRAAERGLPVALAGARHTMGGHTIAPDGICINMLSFSRLALDAQTGHLRAQAGARWADVLAYLEPRGLSVGVMQSNNSFSVGGSLNANAHGWQHNHPPIAATVAALRLLRADGAVVTCSRAENRELFGLALGGYGLFGVILDVELRVVPNRRYRAQPFVGPSDAYAALYAQHVDARADAGMAYGRLDVSPHNFLREAMLTVFYADDGGPPPPLGAPGQTAARRTVFRGSVGSGYGKELRWDAEKRLAAASAGRIVSRNGLLNESVHVFENRSDDSTDILHEYFVPPARLEAFLERVRAIIPAHGGDLLNVTIRNVHADGDSFLRYATDTLFGLVMLFNHPRTPEADGRMQRMTRALVDAALEQGGRHYLPYRLHASAAQLARAYPQAGQFFALKRKHDPAELFQNRFYQTYGMIR